MMWQMAEPAGDVRIEVVDPLDAPRLASLWSRWRTGVVADQDFEERMRAWLEAEGERRTIWMAIVDAAPVGVASLFEYRRMPAPERPDSRWGYVGNMFVEERARNRGIGSALLQTIIDTAEDREYVRLVLSPSPRSRSFYARAGFRTADGSDAAQILVRPSDRS